MTSGIASQRASCSTVHSTRVAPGLTSKMLSSRTSGNPGGYSRPPGSTIATLRPEQVRRESTGSTTLSRPEPMLPRMSATPGRGHPPVAASNSGTPDGRPIGKGRGGAISAIFFRSSAKTRARPAGPSCGGCTGEKASAADPSVSGDTDAIAREVFIAGQTTLGCLGGATFLADIKCPF